MNMTYSIPRAEQELQAKHEKLNLRWYPRYHLAARAGWINDPNGLLVRGPNLTSGAQ